MTRVRLAARRGDERVAAGRMGLLPLRSLPQETPASDAKGGSSNALQAEEEEVRGDLGVCLSIERYSDPPLLLSMVRNRYLS